MGFTSDSKRGLKNTLKFGTVIPVITYNIWAGMKVKEKKITM